MDNPLNSNCVICFNEIEPENKCVTNCQHTYCNGCIMNWFNRGKVTCPICRVNVENFVNNGTVNHLIKIEDRNNENENNDNRMNNLDTFRRLYNQNIYLKFIIITNVLYTFYNVYRLSNYENLYYRYKDSYQNCSDTLEQEINKLNMVNYCGNLINHLFSHHTSEYITKCFFPLSFINKC